jgi:hypothetical protein
VYIKLTIIDSEALVKSPPSESPSESPSEYPPSEYPPAEYPPAEFSDWDGFSDTLSFNSASDAFTDNYTDSEPEEINSS